MSRPSDEMMVEVVKVWQGWGESYCFPARYPGQISCFRPKDDYDAEYVKDPRDDTDAALELLGWLLGQMETKDQGTDYLLEHDVGWTVMRYTGYGHPEGTLHELPISGEPFRYAVCNLAVEVVKNKAQD